MRVEAQINEIGNLGGTFDLYRYLPNLSDAGV